jgi:hypothetical protein
MPRKEVTYRAKVQKIIPNGKHGPYAVATSEKLNFTFSLDEGVWGEEDWPEEGTYVVLSRVSKKAGWRAGKARFLQPSDEQ